MSSFFGTSGVRGPVGETVTAGLALSVGRAVATEGARRVVVGRDPRESGKTLVDALAAGVRECGADVVDLGVASTPTVARSVGWEDADAGVVVTASHNPAPDNGLKLWDEAGRAYDETKRAAVEDHLDTGRYDLRAAGDLGGRKQVQDATDRHVEALVDAVRSDESEGEGEEGHRDEDDDQIDSDRPGKDLSVVVDVGNGAGGVTVDALRALGCSVRTLHARPDGTFPGRPSEPTAEHCSALRALVANTDADVGVAHDGDADRTLAVADDGTWVSGDRLLALFGRRAVREHRRSNGFDSGVDSGSGPKDTLRVAAPLNTSLVVDDALEDVDATVTHTPVGDTYVAARTTDPGVVFGGEPSGAWIWPTATPCPDGPLAACRLVELVAADGPLSKQVASLGDVPVRRTSVETDRKATVMNRVRTHLVEAYGGEDGDGEVRTTDGVRVDVGDAWFLVRASGTQPLVRVTAQARSQARTEEVFETARTAVEDRLGS